MCSSYRRDAEGRLMLNWEEAKEIRDEHARTRDFWIFDMETNKELLQAALDVLHNSIEGTYYFVDYMESQNGCRLIVTCKPCNTQLSSYDPFMSHDLGKNHKKSIQQQINKYEDERISSIEVSFKTLNTPKNIFEPDSLEDMLDQCAQRVLGAQFLYKEQLHGPESCFWYSCQLCGVTRLKRKAMFAHLTEDTLHNRKYLLAKFDLRISTADAYVKKCKETETLEGKVCHNIVDFTHQFKLLRKLQGGGTPPASPPPSPTHRSPSPVTAPLSPPAPLVTHAEVQVDTDELDMQSSLCKEIATMKLNDGDQHLSKDFEAIELMFQTLQTLNLKMHTFYSRTSPNLMHNTGKYQIYLSDTHKKLQQCLGHEASATGSSVTHK